VLHIYGILKQPDEHSASQPFWAAVLDIQASRENAEVLLRGDTTPFHIDDAP
jgi:hypothetical protein